MMNLSIEYDRELVRRALNLYFLERIGSLTIVVLALMFMGAVAAIVSEPLTWLGILMAFAVAVFVGIVALLYVARRRQSLVFFGDAERASVDFGFDDEGIRMRSHMGESTLVWDVFDELLRFDGIWLLVYLKGGYITLPLDQVPEECRALITSRVAS